MNISYNAAVTIIVYALGWNIDKAKHILLVENCIPEPTDRDAPCVPTTFLGILISNNFCDRNNKEY